MQTLDLCSECMIFKKCMLILYLINELTNTNENSVLSNTYIHFKIFYKKNIPINNNGEAIS